MAGLNHLNFQLSFLNLSRNSGNDVNNFGRMGLQRGMTDEGTWFGSVC